MSTDGGGTGGGSTGGGGNNATTVMITFIGPSMPGLVAAQVGTGAFAAEALSGSVLTLSIPSGTSNYSVAFLCPALGTGQSSSQFEYVWEASIVDGTSLTFACAYPQSETPTLSGSLNATAIPGVTAFQINAQSGTSLGEGGGGFSGGPTGNFNVPAPTGSDRVLVLANGNQGNGPLAAKNYDNQAVPGTLNSGNTVVFGTTDETTPEPITYNDVPSGFKSPSTNIWLGMGGTALQYTYASDATTQYLALPASASEQGDVYILDASASSTNLPSSVNTEIVSSGGPVSFTFPPPWNYATPTPAALPSFAMDYTGFSGEANVAQNAWIFWKPGNGGDSTENIQVEATANYQSGSTTLAIPDLSSLAGFFAPPLSGTVVEWTIWMQQQSWSLTAETRPNGTLSEVSNGGQYTVP
ncbi:MAG TPA: hypothetical protein VMF56_13940 [Acidobacteriaceae bacterium]|nr:hypothetical protein [Acidobacteriaceae bacterium]